VSTVLTATACFGGGGEPVNADVEAVEANLRRLGARCPRARVDERRGRLEATFEVEADGMFQARAKLDRMLDEVAHATRRPVIGTAAYALE
jgi:hypothetical protein